MATSDLFLDIPGQEQAIRQLQESLADPLHAYAFLGPQGSGSLRAARDFAAGLLCENGGCGICESCFKVRRGIHPDVLYHEPDGTQYNLGHVTPRKDGPPAHETITGQAQRRPLEGPRTIIIIERADLLRLAAPALLKTLEKPPPTTVFLLLANDFPRDLETIRSRCVVISFDSLQPTTIAEWLIDQGIGHELAASLAEGSAGDADRALLLAKDPDYVQRLALWQQVPDRLDGSGSTATELALEVHNSLKDASAMLEQLQAQELDELTEDSKARGERSLPGKKELLDRHKREIRRFQTNELIAGLAILARRYRDRMLAAERSATPSAPETMRACGEAVDTIGQLVSMLPRNPRQPLALERLFLQLSHEA